MPSERNSGYVCLPTPKDFDKFIPWLCLKVEAPRNVYVKRFQKEEYRSQGKRASLKSKLLKESTKSRSKREVQHDSNSSRRTDSYLNKGIDKNNAVCMKTYYNSQGLLVEVEFINCFFAIPRKIIWAIRTCLPFHPAFYRLTIKGGGLIQSGLNEIGKLLPYSNLTEICLDGNHVPEGNYGVILENVNSLQNLSLRRCKINDKICKEIANMLEYGTPASKCLATLDLTSNEIDELGAHALGVMLRKNRILLHLNLADNKLTDKGIYHIFNSLNLFALTDDEIRDLKIRYLKYCFKKVKVYRQCEKEIINCLDRESKKENVGPKRSKKKINKSHAETSCPMVFDNLTIMERIEKMAKEIVNDFVDVFDNQNTRIKNNQIYAIGNLKICYLNFAYNNISYFSVKKLYGILKYQRALSKPAQCTGLIKVVLDGNNIPKTCKELKNIDTFLQEAVTENYQHHRRRL